MNTPRNRDLVLLAAGGFTGWWDDRGVPAPWPEDFFDAESDWQPAGGETTTEPGKQPF